MRMRRVTHWMLPSSAPFGLGENAFPNELAQKMNFSSQINGFYGPARYIFGIHSNEMVIPEDQGATNVTNP